MGDAKRQAAVDDRAVVRESLRQNCPSAGSTLAHSTENR